MKFAVLEINVEFCGSTKKAALQAGTVWKGILEMVTVELNLLRQVLVRRRVVGERDRRGRGNGKLCLDNS